MKKKILVFGGSGLVGSRFIELFDAVFEIKSPPAEKVDILNKDQVAKSIEECGAEIIINFAAYTQVEKAENQKGDKEGICYLINAMGAKNVSEACKEFDKKLLHVSTEYVFDGQKKDSPYKEEDIPNPLNWYGQTKYYGEQFVLESGCNLALARICMPFRSSYELKKDIARFFLQELQKGNEITAVEDQSITPTLVDDIVYAFSAMIENKAGGIYHISSKNSITPFGFAKLIAREFNLNESLVKPISLEEYNKNKTAKLLKNSWLDSSKFSSFFKDEILHTIEKEVEIFKQQLTAVV